MKKVILAAIVISVSAFASLGFTLIKNEKPEVQPEINKQELKSDISASKKSDHSLSTQLATWD